MLQHQARKKSSSLIDDLVIGGACIIHHKFNQNKKAMFHLKTDKNDKLGSYFNPDLIEDSQSDTFTFKISSSQKNKIKYLKHIYQEKISKATSPKSSKVKSQKSLFKKKTIISTEDDIFKDDEEVSSSASKRFKKKLKIIALENSDRREFSSEKSQTKLQRKILPQITQKYRSYTTSNSKKQLEKDLLYGYGQESINKSLSRVKKVNRMDLPLPDLQYAEDEQKKPRLHRNNTSKVEKLDFVNNSEKIETIKQKESANSSVAKKVKKEFQSQKDIKILTDQACKIVKDDKQKIAKFHIIRDEFTSIINKTNEIEVNNESSYFNAFVQKGNNGMLIKELIKKRWWWHLSDQNPRQKVSEGPSKSKQGSSNTQPLLITQKKKINLYWSEWLNKSFAQKLQMPNQNIINFKTIYDEFQFVPPEEQQKYECVKKITDQYTFSMIRDKISLRNANYFKSRFPKPVQNDEISKSSQTQDFSAKFQRDSPYEMQPTSFKRVEVPHQMKIHNHVIGCLQLHSKKLLFKNFSSYLKKKNMDPFEFIPLTFYIEDLNSQNYEDFLRYQKKHRQQSKQDGSESIWILKPGQNSNRGFGISIHKQKQQIQQELIKRLNFKPATEEEIPIKKVKKSVIVQKYLEKCFLYFYYQSRINNRKFDFRCYILITTANGFLKGYWYGNGYIRTSSEEYDLSDIQNRMIHLTNDAVQSKNSSFGKFEDYNKMNFEGFKKYLQRQNIPESKFDEAFKRMKNIAYYLIASVSPKIKRYQYTFQLFGLDFMLDQNLNPYLIEANSNPCLDTKGPILTKIIRNLVQNVIMTAIDPLFPPPKNVAPKKKKQELDRDYFEANMFELIFSDKKN